MWYSLHTAACNHFTTHLFVAFGVPLKIVKQVVFSRFFETLRAQNKCIFFPPRKPRTTVFTMFCASGSKNRGICSVFETSPSKKHWYLCDFQHVARSIVFICQEYQKNTIISEVWFPSATQNRRKATDFRPPPGRALAHVFFVFLKT